MMDDGKSNCRHILVMRMSALGDLFELTKTISILRAYWPDATIDLMTSSLGVELYQGSPLFRHIFVWPHKSVLRNLKAFFELAGKMRGHHYDLIVDMHCKRVTGYLAALLHKKRIVRTGNGPIKRSLFGKPSYSRDIAEMLIGGGEPSSLVSAVMKTSYVANYPVPDAVLETVRLKLQTAGWDRNRPMVALCPGSSPGWPSKRWPTAHFAALAKRLYAEQLQLVVLGSYAEKELADSIASECNIINLCGETSLQELVAVLSFCTVALTNDSGPMHAAAVVNTPTLALFGPTKAKRHGPDYIYGSPHRSIQASVDCSPCYLGKCPLPRLECMCSIPADYVYTEILSLVNQHD